MATDTTTTTDMGPLLRMVSTTASDYWNDSCAVAELEYAVANGAVGATSNPSIVGEVMKKEWDVWQPRVLAIRDEHPTWTDVEITWRTIEEMAARGAKVLEPIWVREAGRKGRLSIQTNPTFFRDPQRMLEQGRYFHTLAPNMQVKFPATSAGLRALEEATYHGVSINATVNFTLPQALAVGEAVERALRRREAEGLDVAHMSPVCTLMIGRLDDWMKAVCERDDIVVDPAAPNWAGIAVLKKAYRIFHERGYRARLLAAAYRHHLHWSELIGGDIVMTMPFQWQKRFNASAIEVRPRFDDPVEPRYVEELYERIPDFRRAYDEDGLRAGEFDMYGATVRTLRSFIASYWDLVRTIDEILLPNPDQRR
jgi:transaldolase